jgi:methyl-accepting chemotaxis protein
VNNVKRNGLRGIRFEMVIAISGLSILICAAFYIAAMSLSQSAISDQMVSSLNKITKQGSELFLARINENFDDLNSIISDSAFISATDTRFQSASANKYQIQTIMNNQATAKGYLGMIYADASGEAYDNVGNTVDITSSVNYAKSMAGEAFVSDPAPVTGTDQATMTYSVPVKLRDAVVGVLMMTTDGYKLCDLVSDLTYGKTGYAFVVNNEGVMVAHPDRAMVQTQDRTLEKAKADSGQKGLADLLGLAISGQSGVGGYTYKGVTKYAGYTPIAGTNWYMVLTAPRGEVFEDVDRLQLILLIAAALLALLSAFVAFLIADRIAKPMRQMMQAAEKFAIGDLDVDVNVRQKNEVGVLARAFQKVSENMSGLIASIRSASEQVAVGSREIASSGMQLASGSTQQASALEELSASVEQIAAQTRQSAGHAAEANQLADITRALAEQGNEKMDNMLRAMAEIDQSSNNIYRIIKVIDDIAFQTNILALNAAVEAARAGEHGRGFAVVAEEVRSLAAKSASAAKETTALIESSSKSVAGGAKLARETADALKKIVDEINRVASLVHSISVASGEQSNGIEQINQGLTQISQVVQANSSTSQQSAAASRQLTAQADTLNQQVAGFKLKGAGAESTRPPEGEAIHPEVVKMHSESKRPEKAEPKPGAAPEATSRRPARNEAPAQSKATPSVANEAPVKGAQSTPARPISDVPIPHSVRAAASAAINAAFARPAKISLGEEEEPAPRPAKISLGDEDGAPAKPHKIALSDSEFGKY